MSKLDFSSKIKRIIVIFIKFSLTDHYLEIIIMKIFEIQLFVKIINKLFGDCCGLHTMFLEHFSVVNGGFKVKGFNEKKSSSYFLI